MVNIKSMTNEQAEAVRLILEEVREAIPDIIDGWYDASKDAQSADNKEKFQRFGDALKTAYDTVYNEM